MKSHLTIIITIILIYSTVPVFGQANQAQTDVSKDYRQGVELFEKGKYNLSIKYFERFIQSQQSAIAVSSIEINNSMFYLAVAAKYSDSPLAEKLLLDYIEQYPGADKVYAAYFHLGGLYFDKKNYKDAIRYYDLTEQKALSSHQSDELLFNKAFSHFALKDFKRAYQGFIPIVRNSKSKHYEDAVYYAGLSAYYLENYSQALEHFQLLDESRKYRNTIPYYIASIQFESKQYDDLIAYIVPKLESNNRLKYTNQIKKLLGNVYFEKEDYQASEKYLSESIRALTRISQEDYYQLGYVYFENGAYDKAIVQLEKLTAQDNKMVQNAMFLLGQSYNQIGNKADAKAAFQQASRMKYDASITEESLLSIAKITYEQSNYTEALSLLREFIKDYPKSPLNSEAQNLLADVFFKTRAYEEAISIIEGMKSMNSQIKASYQKMTFYRAMEYYSNDQLYKADEYLDKSLTFTAETSLEALAYYWKADIAHVNGRYDESNSWLTKFNSIASSISIEHSSRVSPGTGFYLQGYNSYKKRDFVSAQILFSKAMDRLKEEQDQVVQKTIYPDAIMRLADSYYMQKKYKEALTQYQKVLNTQAKGVDYAAYQSAMIKGLIGDVNGKTDGLAKVFAEYPSSTYADDALFELGNTYNNVGKSSEAINTLRNLTKTYPKSAFVPYAYNRIGLIQYNQGNVDDALASYQHVIKYYGKTGAVQEALIAVRDVYITKGDPDGYFELMRQHPGAMVSTSTQDSIVYQVAENQYLKGDYTQAVKGFDAYLNTYSNGAFVLQARFYRGESKYFSGNQVGALTDYEYIIKQYTNKFTETALQRAATISFNQKNFAESAKYYEQIREVARTEDVRNNAVLGAMRSYFKSNNFSKAIEYANQAYGINGLSEMIQVEATYYKGIAQYNLGNLKEAGSNLKSVVKRINNEWAAESQYILAVISYHSNQLKEAEALCFELISDYPSYPEWMVRTYILLSDIYVNQEDYFKAKVTLQSVVDTYNNQDELYQEAVKKLEKVKELESKDSKIVPPNHTSGFSEFEK